MSDRMVYQVMTFRSWADDRRAQKCDCPADRHHGCMPSRVSAECVDCYERYVRSARCEVAA